MFLSQARWYLALSWMSLALVAFFALNASSMRSLLLLAVLGFVPPIVILVLSKQRPPTIAEVLDATERGR